MPRTRAERSEVEEALTRLREIVKPGDTLDCVLRNVSRSGMSREISVYKIDDDGRSWLSGYMARAGLGRLGKRDGNIIGGCGMDMGFALVNHLSSMLYREYQCLGKGKCPSAYHVNHRDMIRCEGAKVGDDYRRCYRPFRGDRDGLWASWPKKTITKAYIVEDGEHEGEEREIKIEIALACLWAEDGESAGEICPTCKGEGQYPNPEGPERFDLVHTDDYALRHRWL